MVHTVEKGERRVAEIKRAMIVDLLFDLLRAALLDISIDTVKFTALNDDEWTQLYRMSVRHGIQAVVYETVSKLPNECQLPRSLNLQWAFGAYHIQNRFSVQQKAAESLAELFLENNIRMLIMKGISLSTYYPISMQRECGDIDIFNFENFDTSNKIIESKGIDVEYHHEKHTVFSYNSISIENHKTFLNVYTKIGKLLNSYLLEVCPINSCKKGVGQALYPNADFNAVFLLCHMSSHFSHEGIIIRNVVDWGLFLLKDGSHINRTKYVELLQRTGMVTAFNVFTAIAADMLAIDFSKYYIGNVNEKLTRRVKETILTTKLHAEANCNFVKRLYKKTCRLFSTRWQYKQLLPYKFWSEVVFHSMIQHIVNPKNI